MSYPIENLPLDQILCGDNQELIRKLPDRCIQLIITSPPYFQQRDYGGGMGNENHVDEYIDKLICLFYECIRVLRNDGNIVFNIGDKYQDSSLLLVPYRFALAATSTELVKLVNEITWVKKNPTPRQFKRRLVSSTIVWTFFVFFMDIKQESGYPFRKHKFERIFQMTPLSYLDNMLSDF